MISGERVAESCELCIALARTDLCVDDQDFISYSNAAFRTITFYLEAGNKYRVRFQEN